MVALAEKVKKESEDLNKKSWFPCSTRRMPIFSENFEKCGLCGRLLFSNI